MPPFSAATQHVFDQGHLIGDLAHQLYPDGINLHTENISDNLPETRLSLKLRKPLFEAGFSGNRLVVGSTSLTQLQMSPGISWRLKALMMSKKLLSITSLMKSGRRYAVTF
jgi:hypothetical protein